MKASNGLTPDGLLAARALYAVTASTDMGGASETAMERLLERALVTIPQMGAAVFGAERLDWNKVCWSTGRDWADLHAYLPGFRCEDCAHDREECGVRVLVEVKVAAQFNERDSGEIQTDAYIRCSPAVAKAFLVMPEARARDAHAKLRELGAKHVDVWDNTVTWETIRNYAGGLMQEEDKRPDEFTRFALAVARASG